MSFIIRPTIISFSIALLATAIVLSTASPAPSHAPVLSPDPNPINSFCVKAHDKDLCTKMIKDATTWPGAMTNALNAALDQVKAGQSIANSVSSKLPANMLSETKESINSTCHHVYEDVVYSIEHSIEFVKEGDYPALESYIDSISFLDCSDSLGEFEVSVSEVNQFKDEVSELARNLRAIGEMKP